MACTKEADCYSFQFKNAACQLGGVTFHTPYDDDQTKKVFIDAIGKQ